MKCKYELISSVWELKIAAPSVSHCLHETQKTTTSSKHTRRWFDVVCTWKRVCFIYFNSLSCSLARRGLFKRHVDTFQAAQFWSSIIVSRRLHPASALYLKLSLSLSLCARLVISAQTKRFLYIQFPSALCRGSQLERGENKDQITPSQQQREKQTFVK